MESSIPIPGPATGSPHAAASHPALPGQKGGWEPRQGGYFCSVDASWREAMFERDQAEVVRARGPLAVAYGLPYSNPVQREM